MADAHFVESQAHTLFSVQMEPAGLKQSESEQHSNGQATVGLEVGREVGVEVGVDVGALVIVMGVDEFPQVGSKRADPVTFKTLGVFSRKNLLAN